MYCFWESFFSKSANFLRYILRCLLFFRAGPSTSATDNSSHVDSDSGNGKYAETQATGEEVPPIPTLQHLIDSNNRGAQQKFDNVYEYFPQGQTIAFGATGVIELLDDGKVLKSPFPGPDQEKSIQDISHEAQIYNALGSNERLVKLLGYSERGLLLEYMENGSLKEYLQVHRDTISYHLRLRWAFQAAEGLQLLHSHEIIHCDMKPRNLLLDPGLNLKIVDFSSSSFQGQERSGCEAVRYYLPRHWRAPSTRKSDLFALGSTLYEIFTGSSPFQELPSDEIEQKFKTQVFPDLSGLACGDIIEQCWDCQVDTAQQVCDGVRARMEL